MYKDLKIDFMFFKLEDEEVFALERIVNV